jgi:hypothetical protein
VRDDVVRGDATAVETLDAMLVRLGEPQEIAVKF